MPPVQAKVGDHPLTGVAGLPNVTVAFPGEHWSNRYASENITPGDAVFPTVLNGRLAMRKAVVGDATKANQVAIALRTVDIPDPNTGPGGIGPNEVKNTVIKTGEYVHAHYSGVFHLTVFVPAVYAPGDLIGWAVAGARPTGKPGVGAWAKDAAADIDSLFEVQEFRPYSANGLEGILTVRSLRGQF
jgi:hypothetical protein